MDDFSIETLYEMGLGFKPVNNSSKVSVEDWDGDRDALAYEMASAESMLDTMDVFSRMTALNSVQQIKCANRIKANYGNCNRGIESYCRNIVQSAESNDAAAGNEPPANTTQGTTPENTEDSAKDKENSKKKTGFWKKVFSALAKFFRKIWQFICSIPARIKAFIVHIKNHGLKGAGKAAGAAGNAKMAAMENKYQAKKKQLGEKLESAVAKCNEIINNIKASVEKMCDKLDKAGKSENLSEDIASILKITSTALKESLTIIQRLFTGFEYGVRAVASQSEEIKQVIVNVGESKAQPLLNGLDVIAKKVKETCDNVDKWEVEAKSAEYSNILNTFIKSQLVALVETIGNVTINFIKNTDSKIIQNLQNKINPDSINSAVGKVKSLINSENFNTGDKAIKIVAPMLAKCITEVLNVVNTFYTDSKFRDAIGSAVIGASSMIAFDKIASSSTPAADSEATSSSSSTPANQNNKKKKHRR